MLIGYPQICVLCLWELTVRDSAAEVVLALFFFISMTTSLTWAAFKVYRIAKRSVSMHKNPAYILYSDPSALNKWGFLYVQFRATAYYFIMPVLVYIFVKALFIAFAQKNGTVQAIGLVIIEAVFLIGVSIFRPWMDKKTNAFNISIAAINFLNVIFLLVFTAVFNQPVSQRKTGAINGVLLITMTGNCDRRHGSCFLYHQRSICADTFDHGPGLHDIRNFVEKSRHSLSANAR